MPPEPPEVSLAWSTQQELEGRRQADDSASEVSFDGEDSDRVQAPRDLSLARREGSVASIGSDSSLGLSAAGSSSDTASSQSFDDEQNAEWRDREDEFEVNDSVMPRAFVGSQLQKKEQQWSIDGLKASPTKNKSATPQTMQKATIPAARNQYSKPGKEVGRKPPPVKPQASTPKNTKAKHSQEEPEDQYSFGEENDGDGHQDARLNSNSKCDFLRLNVQQQQQRGFQKKHQKSDTHLRLSEEDLAQTPNPRHPDPDLHLQLSDAEGEESPRWQLQQKKPKPTTPASFLERLEEKYGGYTRAFDAMGAQAAARRPRGMASMTQGAALDSFDFEIACESLQLLGPGDNALDMFEKLDFDGGKSGRNDKCLTVVDILDADRELRSTSGGASTDPGLLGLRLFWPEFVSNKPAVPVEMFEDFLTPSERRAMAKPRALPYSTAQSPGFGGYPVYSPMASPTGFAATPRTTPDAFRHPAGPRRLRAG